jgi:hypothetical protein
MLITKLNRLKLFRDIITAYWKNLKKFHILCERKTQGPSVLIKWYAELPLHFTGLVYSLVMMTQIFSATLLSYPQWASSTNSYVDTHAVTWCYETFSFHKSRCVKTYHETVQDISPVPDATSWACTRATYSNPISYDTRFPWNTISTIRGTFRSLAESFRTQNLLKKFPAFYGPWRFIAMFTTAAHWSLSSVRRIQSIISPSLFFRLI